jgi:uncharacterized protein YkwD
MLSALLLFLMLLSTIIAPIRWDGRLEQLAQERVGQLAQGQTFEHTDYIPSRLAYCGCGLYGEMLGRTTGGSIDLFHAFLNSPSHKAIMLGEWDKMAIALDTNDDWKLIIVVVYLGDCDG